MASKTALWTALAAVALAMGPTQALATEAPSTSGAAPAPGEAAAETALTDAEALLTGGESGTRATVPGATGAPAAPTREATMVLRDLYLRYGQLDGPDRATARALMARPTDGGADPARNGYPAAAPKGHLCAARTCMHWVDSGRYADAPPMADADADGTPDWVQTTSATFESVWRRTVNRLGYRAPLPDGRGETDPDATPAQAAADRDKLDIYLADLGSDGLYGYCWVDNPNDRRRVLPAYCVVDEDFARSQFGAPPLNSLRVTAAHEFFHAVQFAYDIGEDSWMMEGTAAWVEDVLFDTVNDNRQYLATSPLRYPDEPLDYPGRGNDTFVYGSWIFWQFLTEYFGKGGRQDPGVVRQVWERAAHRRTGPDQYSLRALGQVTARRGTPFAAVFTGFGLANRNARAWYDEGAGYPQAPVGRQLVPTRARPRTATVTTRLDHLANHHVRYRPGSGIGTGWKLRVTLDLPDRVRGSRGTVTVHRRGGGARQVSVGLDRRGDAVLTVPFAGGSISFVDVTTTNASVRSVCRRGSVWSCHGRPADDALSFSVRATAVR